MECNMHKCSYEQSFAIIEGKLTLCAIARWNKYCLEVYQRDENQTRTRNLYYNTIAGYCVEFPEEYDNDPDEWRNAGNIRPYLGDDIPNSIDQEKVCRLYPDFKYIFRKCDLSYTEVMDILPIWKKYPKVELLLANGWKRVAFNKSFYRMLPEKRKKLMLAMRDHVGENLSVNEFKKIQEGWTSDQLKFLYKYELREIRNKLNLEMIGYIERNADVLDLKEYADYINMAIRAGHDVYDRYWTSPSDFRKMHLKVIRECNRIEKLKKERELSEKQEKYENAVRSMLGKVANVGSINVFIPRTCQEIQKHADKLHQCLVTADYIGKVAKGECLLVFITEKGKPLATAELKPKGRKFKIGQFYGDERKSDYMAPQRAKEALNEWAKKNKVNIAA